MYILECLKLKMLTIPSVNEDGKSLEHSYIAGRNTKWFSLFVKQLSSGVCYAAVTN